jgi:quercetin dioxygenase-like cupin family protein
MSNFFPSSEELAQHTIFPGVTVNTCACERMMLSLAKLEPRSVVAEHAHPHEQVGIVLEGRATFYIGSEEKPLGPGDLFRIPGNVPHKVITLDERVRVLDVFNPVRDEYR